MSVAPPRDRVLSSDVPGFLALVGPLPLKHSLHGQINETWGEEMEQEMWAKDKEGSRKQEVKEKLTE